MAKLYRYLKIYHEAIYNKKMRSPDPERPTSKFRKEICLKLSYNSIRLKMLSYYGCTSFRNIIFYILSILYTVNRRIIFLVDFL